jgi:hypothetical protein
VPCLSVWALLQHFWGTSLEFGVVFFTSLSLAQHPRPARRTTPGRHHGTMLIQRERASCTVNQRGELGCTKEPRMAWEPTWEPCSSDWFKTQVQIQACLRRQKGSLIKSQRQRHSSTHLLGWNHVSPVQGAVWKYCAVWECVKVWAWDTAQLQSECGVPIRRYMVNSCGPGWALTRPPVQGLYRLTTAKRCLNPHKGSSQRRTKWVVLFVFPCVLERRTPYLLSTTLIPSISVSVLTSGNRRNGRRTE